MQYDILIKNAMIFDGTGARSFRANVIIKNGKIVKIGEAVDDQICEKVINADKKFLCPGFIDIQNISDHYLTLLSNPKCENLIKQGITTILVGHSGSSLSPLIKNNLNSFKPWADIENLNVDWRSFKTFLQFLNTKHLGVNVASLIGWNVMRNGLIGDHFKNLSDFELKQLLILAKQSMKEGAWGVSFGFGYPSGRAITKREILAVHNEIKKFDPLFSFNLRDESNGFIMALKEILDITRESKINTLITGMKVQNADNFVYFEEALKLIDSANKERNNNIHFTIYPYEYTCRPLITFMPDWLTIGDEKALRENLNDKDIVKKLVRELKQNKSFYKKLVLIDIDNQYRMLKGKTFEQIAKNMNLSIEESLVKVMSMTQKKIIVLNPNLSSINIDKGIKHNASLVVSHGMSIDNHNLNNGFIDQRSVGSFVKYLATYKNILSFETLIHKITGNVKEVMGLKNKGHIKIGMDADLVILNVNNLVDRSTIQNAMVDPKGIETVIINGQVVLDNSQIIDCQAGKVIVKGN